MESGEAPAQRPVTLDITGAVEDITQEAPAPAALEPTSSQPSSSSDNALFQDESIDLGGESFITPQEYSSATPSDSLMDKLNDQMMESVMISDSPNNSEEDDVAPIDSLLEGGEEEEEEVVGEPGASGDKEEASEIGQNTTEIKIPVEESETECSEEKAEEDLKELGDTKEQVTVSVSNAPQIDTPSPCSPQAEEPAPEAAKETGPKDEPVPVCTIFSQGSQPKSLVPDGFQPTLIKSPSFSMGSSGVNVEAVTPSKLTPPLVCQPSPSLSKFFSDSGQVNPASDFFDSFTTSSSFVSVSNPNAESPPATAPAPVAPTPERQLSSTSSSLSTPGGPTDSGAPTPSSFFSPAPTEATSKPPQQPPPPQAAPAQAPAPPAQAPAPASAPQPQPFNQLQAVFSGSDDPFATAFSLSEVDKRHDAWLPSEETRKVLISVATQQYSPVYVERDRLTMPGLKFDNLQVLVIDVMQKAFIYKKYFFLIS